MTVTAHARAVLRVRNLLFGGWAVVVVLAVVLVMVLTSARLTIRLPIAAAVFLVGASPALLMRENHDRPCWTVPLDDRDAPELLLVVRQIALQLEVPPPASIALSPECDAWLEPDGERATLVVGTPFLWWLRVTELRGLLAPVLAGSAVLADARVRAARQFMHRLDLAKPRVHCRTLGPVLGRACDLLTGECRRRAEAMERAIAALATMRAQPVEPAGRVIAHEQVGLVAAAWDRVIAKLAWPAWVVGHAPLALGVAVAAALTELGARDRRSGELTTRLAERPACDLLEEPGRYDAAVSLLAADVYTGGSTLHGVGWGDYLATVVAPPRHALAARAAGWPELAPISATLATYGLPVPRDVTASGGHRDASTPAGASPTPAASGAPPLPQEHAVGDGTHAAGVALVECALVDARLASWAIDWLDGVLLRHMDGAPVPVTELVGHALDEGDTGPLARCLDRLTKAT